MNRNGANLVFMEQVSLSYQSNGSLEKTAKELGIGYAKVRKILITLGEYQNEFSIAVKKAYDQGLSIAEIGDALKTSINRVSAHLPYARVLYLADQESADSQKSKLYRKRIQQSVYNFVASKLDFNTESEAVMKPANTESREFKSVQSRQFEAVHLKVTLVSDCLEEEFIPLQKYGGTLPDGSITRDLLIPSDMPLHNLHYAIQKLFGWQNSHLRCFNLPDEIYQKVTGGTVKGWVEQVGILFQPPSEFEEDIFWDDHYEKGSIKTWLKSKYTGPYVYGGFYEQYDEAKKDVQALLADYPLIDLTIDELHERLLLETGVDYLLETLEITKILAPIGEKLNPKQLFPVSHEILYAYDFGDNWKVSITREQSCDSLIEGGLISMADFEAARKAVLSEHRPVCLHRQGLSVLDDVGGLSGFAEFLNTIYESDDDNEVEKCLNWAKYLGWSKRKVAAKLML